MSKRSEVTLSDIFLYDAIGDEVTPEEFVVMAAQANKFVADMGKTKKKPKAKYIPFEQFVEENCIIRGQE